MSVDFISSFYEHGIAPTAALICTSLYLQQMVREKTSDRERESKGKIDDEKYSRLVDFLTKLMDGQQTLLDNIRGLTSNTVTLADMSKGLSHDNQAIMVLTNTLVSDLKVLAVNQLNLMNGFQKVIEQLISALKDN